MTPPSSPLPLTPPACLPPPRQSVRLWASAAAAEVEWTVGPVDVSDGQSHEVITRYAAPLDTGGAWATDANCRESQPRVRGARANWTVALSEPVSGNYNPVNCVIREGGGSGGRPAEAPSIIHLPSPCRNDWRRCQRHARRRR